jgi:hypothetical protein
MLLLHEMNIRSINIEVVGLSVRVKRSTWETHHVFIKKTNRLRMFSRNNRCLLGEPYGTKIVYKDSIRTSQETH